MQLSVIVPIFEAQGYLRSRLELLLSFLESSGLEFEVIAVDDGSRDETPAILSRLAGPRLRVLTLPENRGKYAALGAGMREARGRCCLFTDADIPFELKAIPYMCSLVVERGFHLIIGDRTLPGSRYSQELSWPRRVLTRWFSLCIRLLVTGGLWDTQCGIKALRGDVARLLFPLLLEPGFAGDVELLYVALKYNLEIKRVPVRLVYQGCSSVRPARDGPRMLTALFRIRRNFLRGRYLDQELSHLARQDYWSGEEEA